MRMRWYNPCPRGNNAEPDGDSPGVDDRTRSSSKGTQAVERGPDGFGKPGESEPKVEGSADRQEAETCVSGCPQENRVGSACTLDEVEGSESKQIKARQQGSQQPAAFGGPCLGLEQRRRRPGRGVLNQPKAEEVTHLPFIHFAEGQASAIPHIFCNDT